MLINLRLILQPKSMDTFYVTFSVFTKKSELMDTINVRVATQPRSMFIIGALILD